MYKSVLSRTIQSTSLARRFFSSASSSQQTPDILNPFQNIHEFLAHPAKLSSAATSFSVSTSSISGTPSVPIADMSEDLRKHHHSKVVRLLGSMLDAEYLSSWVFPGLQAEFGEDYSLVLNLDHYGPYTSLALLRLYPIFSLEQSLSATPDFDALPENIVYNVYDVTSSSKMDQIPRVYVYRELSHDTKELSYPQLIQTLGEIISEFDGIPPNSEQYGQSRLKLIKKLNTMAPVDRVTVQWYDQPTQQAIEDAILKASLARPTKSKKQRKPPAFDLGVPTLKTELNLPELSNKFYFVLNPSTVVPQQ